MVLNVEINQPQPPLKVAITLPTTGVTAIYGASGSGKTTLLRIIAGLQPASADTRISFNSTTWQTGLDCLATHHRRLGFVFQEPRLFEHLTVIDNIRYAFKRRVAGVLGPDVDECINLLGLNPIQQRYADQLSGGEKQRVAIARALANAPQLLLLDEPLTGLDPSAREQILHALEAIHRNTSTPMLYVSHQLEEIHRLADHVCLLEQHVLSAPRSIEEISTDPTTNIAQLASSATIWRGNIVSVNLDQGIALVSSQHGNQLKIPATVSTKPGNALLRLRIPAHAVSVALTPAEQSSIINILPATIDTIAERGNNTMCVRLRLGNDFLLAHLTRYSVNQLKLSIGTSVYAQIKGVALLSDAQ